MSFFKKIILTITIVLSIGGFNISLSGAEEPTSILAGKDRLETAINISRNGWSVSDNVIIVNGAAIPDALSATPFAKAKNSPILLTQKEKLDERVKIELKRLKTKNTYLIGGTSILNENIENQLSSMGINCIRIFGQDRYSTSLELAKALDKNNPITQIAVANGVSGLADAVSVGAPAAQLNIPIILADPNQGTKIADDFIKSKNIKKTYIIGGESVLSKSIENNLPNPKRISGQTRNDTNANVIDEFYKSKKLNKVYISKNGMSNQNQLIDALAVGPLAAKNESPVIISDFCLSNHQKKVFFNKDIMYIVKVGGGDDYRRAFYELLTNEDYKKDKSEIDKASELIYETEGYSKEDVLVVYDPFDNYVQEQDIKDNYYIFSMISLYEGEPITQDDSNILVNKKNNLVYIYDADGNFELYNQYINNSNAEYDDDFSLEYID
ncbi:cell wall-binding repeat-containing protein [Romboutsia maritimum]|uniref:cell wall-binding repeat-containing protein n=1 Tax=Romboutsia maritimum TaxID=2020948 RepID=UPI0013148060|nr:cell wall-binding repeat-containing protein [Romboutsia maritimum]